MNELFDAFKKSVWFSLVSGIFSIVVGLICMIQPEYKAQSLVFWECLLILGYGILYVIAAVTAKEKQIRIRDGILGAILCVLAVAGLMNKALLGKYLPVLLGFTMIICGILNLVRSSALMIRTKQGIVSVIASAAVIVFGLIILLNPSFSGKIFGIMAGISLIINGVSGLISFVQYKKAVSQ